MQTLKDLRVGASAVVSELRAEGRAARRLADMGLTAGARVTVLRAAPFGDPMVVLVRGYRLALRKRDAAAVRLK